MPFIRIFFIGMLISFLGTLPLGVLNITAMQLTISDGLYAGLLFSAGALLVEMVYVRLSLVAMDWVRKQVKLIRWLEWFTLIVLVVLAIGAFMQAATPQQEQSATLNRSLPPFFLGVLLSAINPVQIPFWFGWSTVLYTKKVLHPSPRFYTPYILGIGIGTFIGNAVFIFGGHLLVDLLKDKTAIIHWIIGGVFVVTALLQGWKMWRQQDVIHQLEHPEDFHPPFS